MKIAILGNANSIHIVKLVNMLSKFGHQVDLYTMASHKNKEDKIEKKIKIFQLGGKLPFAYFFSAFKLKKYLKSMNYDVVNAHYASGYGTLARLAGARPLVLSVWGSDVYDFPFQSRQKYNITLKNLNYANHVLSTSKSMTTHVNALFGSTNEIATIPFGVDLDEFKFPYVKEIHENTIRIGVIKSLRPVYGIDYAINIFEKVLKQIGKEQLVEFHIYGDGFQKRELELLAESLNLKERVFFHGYINHAAVEGALESLDIFFATSIRESFGVALVEAMAKGLPVVATDTDGFREIVDNNITGFVIDRNNEQQIVEALCNLINNSDLRKEIGLAGREKVERFYDYAMNVKEMIKIFEKVKRNWEKNE